MRFPVFFIAAVNNFNYMKSVLTVFITVPVTLRVMESAAINHLEILTRRLNEAERRAKLLKLEVKSIQNEIAEAKRTTNPTNSNGNVVGDVPDWGTFYFDREPSLPSTSSLCGPSTSNKRVRDNNSAVPTKKLKGSFTKQDDYVEVYTDGACENNGRPNARAGIGVWFGEGHPLNISKPVEGKPTNNAGEIQACVQALQTLKEHGEYKVKIFTDSEFTINCMTKWIKTWRKNNWKTASGGPVKNKEDLQKLDSAINALTDVQWEHVAGHSGIRGNEEADKLARQGALQYRH